ncbi:MAG: restriction endonuclease subunit S [Nitrospira sp.]|nr:restriction endonuclease subunit S [Nitrospira sp.]
MTVDEKRLDELVDFYNGKAPPKSSIGEYPVFGSNGQIGWANQFNHEAGIIIGRVGAYCGSVEVCEGKFWASDNTIVVKPKSGHQLRYLYFRLKSMPLRAYAGGAAQPLLTQGSLRAVRAYVADVDAQSRISSVLSAYDDLIDNNRRRIELLEEAARQLYKEWFVRFRFPGHEHVNIIDGVPEGWERKTLGDVADTNAQSYNKTNLPEHLQYIDISSVTEGRILTKTPLSAPDAPGRARRIAHHGDVIWSNVRPNLRAYSLVLSPENNDVFSTGFTVLSPKSVPFSFLYQFVTTENFVSHLVNHTTGASYPAVRPTDFERAEILVPKEQLLEQFHSLVEPSYLQISLLEKQNIALAEARDLLLPKLMSGEIAA